MTLVLFLAVFVMLSVLNADEIQPLTIGEAAPHFKLPAADGKQYALDDFNGDILVLIFTANHCPTAQAYEDKIIKLVDEYKNQSVSIVAISPNDPAAVALEELGYSDLGDSFADMKLRAAWKKYNFPYLYDGETQETAKKYGPQATPHVFIFDQKRKLQYQGRFDDTENPFIEPKQADVRRTLEALLTGQKPPVQQTKVFGCSIKWANKAQWVAQLTADWESKPVEVNPIDLPQIQSLIKNDSGKFRLINVWATWCGPCVIEFPELIRIHRMYQGRRFELVTLSADKAAAGAQVKEFLQKQHAAVKNYHAIAPDVYQLIDAVDKEWPGALPHTLLIAPDGRIVYRHTGIIDPLELKRAIIDQLGRYYAND